ncbi:MAG: caspase family protein [Akkermansiaceae bacterium]|nr:caspase family protein [Akkermansiaceae bacterium]MCF7996192.1 caspase family protein [Chromatiaceae bacterium]
MNRKAILIGASPPDDPLRYVAADVALWDDFLRSPEGGAWDASEILDASHIDKSTLQKEFSRVGQFDFTVVVFAGHGYTVQTDLPWTELNVVLESGETVLERELNPGTPRCCIVLDCCRTRGENVAVIKEHRKKASLEEAYTAVLARQAYETALDHTEKGAVSIYSTGDNTTAADRLSFSQYLIRSAVDWTRSNRGILPIKEAVQLGASELVKTHRQQHPEYNGGRRLHHFPFAISV